MKQRRVVIVAFPGIAVARRRRAVRGLRRRHPGGPRVRSAGGYEVTLVSTDGQPVRAESGVGLCTEPLPDPSGPDRHPGASRRWSGAGGPAATTSFCRGSRRWPPGAGGWPPCARVPSWPPRPVCSTVAGSPPTGPAPSSWPPSSRPSIVDCRSDLHPGRQVLDQRRRHRRHRPGPGPGGRTTSASRWPRPLPAGW